MNNLSRRRFLISSAVVSAATCLSANGSTLLTGGTEADLAGQYAIPTSASQGEVTFSTTVRPTKSAVRWTLNWEVATDELFTNIVNSESITGNGIDAKQVNVTVVGAPLGTKLFYRVSAEHATVDNDTVGITEENRMQLHVMVKKELHEAPATGKTIELNNVA